MAISDLLTQLNSVKLAIKNALIDKGVNMTGVPFTEYASKINEISTQGVIIKDSYNVTKTSGHIISPLSKDSYTNIVIEYDVTPSSYTGSSTWFRLDKISGVNIGDKITKTVALAQSGANVYMECFINNTNKGQFISNPANNQTHHIKVAIKGTSVSITFGSKTATYTLPSSIDDTYFLSFSGFVGTVTNLQISAS